MTKDVGGWIVDGTCSIPAEVKAAFDQVSKKIVGASYEAVFYCGHQTGIQGSNYMLLAKQVIGSQTPVTRLMKMFIHKDVSGEAVVMAIMPFEVFRSFQLPVK